MSDERPQLTVTLSHDQWQWVMSLVPGSQYLRAKPIVEAVEAAISQHRAGQQASPQQRAAEQAKKANGAAREPEPLGPTLPGEDFVEKVLSLADKAKPEP